MVAAFLLGLTGSLGHCVGMCSGVVALLSRRGAVRGWRVLLLHLGRVTTYGALGAAAGGIGYSIVMAASYCSVALTGTDPTAHAEGAMPILGRLQGVLALGTAVLALYMALSLLGWLPSPEILLINLTRRWGLWMKKSDFSKKSDFWSLYASGLLWGLLPCGLVMTGLVAAAVTGSVWRGALTMLAFGAGTWPVTIGVSVLARWRQRDGRPLALPQLRYAAALIVLAFGIQMALRGFAAWGWITHYRLGEVVLW
ncbi:MAG: sulfite exporter TauE/SafE family protein [Chloroflexi bacterium]|nr:sulfite exporter TauE/SafE family protein [Chloroflexota bacterium]